MTEDYKLFQAVCEKQNRRFLQLFHPAVLSSTRPVYTWKELLQQRRRWFRGGREIAVYNKLMLLFNASVVPFLILSAFLNPMAVTLVAWSLKVMADFLFLMTACVLLHKTDKMKWFPFYEIYYQVMSLVIPLQQALPGRIIWKGREI